MGMYKCKVKFFLDTDEDMTDYLAVYGANYEEVAQHVAEYYGNDEVYSLSIEALNDVNFVQLSKSQFKTLEPTF